MRHMQKLLNGSTNLISYERISVVADAAMHSIDTQGVKFLIHFRWNSS